MLATELQSHNTADEFEMARREDDMKFQNRIRMQMAMLGLGAALLMAGSAGAQQDMDPTYFDVNPGTPAVSKVVAVRATRNSQAARETASAESTLALANRSDVTLEAGVTRMAIVDAGAALILLAGIVSIVIYAMAATRRERALRVSPMTAPYTPVSAATAQ
jgi:hypothetical protein